MARQPIRMLGDPSLTRHACGRADLRPLERDDDVWFMLALKGEGDKMFPKSPSLVATQQETLFGLLSEFPAVTHPLDGLPPPHRSDHLIILHMGVSFVSVCPYRFNNSQNDEKKKLVAKMLAARIIQPSSSLY